MLLTVTVTGAYVGERLLGNFEDTEGDKVWEAMDRIPDLFDRGTVGGTDEEVQDKWHTLPTGTVEETLEAAKDQHFIEDYTIEKNATAFAEYWDDYRDNFLEDFHYLVDQRKKEYDITDEDYERVMGSDWDSDIQERVSVAMTSLFDQLPEFMPEKKVNRDAVVEQASQDAYEFFINHYDDEMDWNDLLAKSRSFEIQFSEDAFVDAVTTVYQDDSIRYVVDSEHPFSTEAWDKFKSDFLIPEARQAYPMVKSTIEEYGWDAPFDSFDAAVAADNWISAGGTDDGEEQAWQEAVEEVQ